MNKQDHGKRSIRENADREHKSQHQSMRQDYYQIKVKERLGNRWMKWFEGWAITNEKDGTMLLTGQVADQAALQGILTKISSLNLTLISVNKVMREPEKDTGQPTQNNDLEEIQ